ncbi:MAG: hypothetical protein ACFB50_02980 [Rubrobacteraceae bacterium]
MRLRTTGLFFLGFVLAFVLVAGCYQGDGQQDAGQDAEGVAADELTVERLVEFEPGAVRVEPPERSPEDETGGAAAGNGEARAGDAVAGDGKARAGDMVAGGGQSGDEVEGTGAGGRSGEVRLRIGGEAGARFSGTCSVGGTERDISGRVPGQYGFDLNGRELECEIRNLDPGALKVVFTADGTRHTQQTNAPGGTLRISYAGNGSSSVSSSSASSVSSQGVVTVD